jgi:hypothetical protein
MLHGRKAPRRRGVAPVPSIHSTGAPQGLLRFAPPLIHCRRAAYWLNRGFFETLRAPRTACYNGCCTERRRRPCSDIRRLQKTVIAYFSAGSPPARRKGRGDADAVPAPPAVAMRRVEAGFSDALHAQAYPSKGPIDSCAKSTKVLGFALQAVRGPAALAVDLPVSARAVRAVTRNCTVLASRAGVHIPVITGATQGGDQWKTEVACLAVRFGCRVDRAIQSSLAHRPRVPADTAQISTLVGRRVCDRNADVVDACGVHADLIGLVACFAEGNRR